VDYDSPQPQKGQQLETVMRKQLCIVDGEKSPKATETQERIQADLRSYEKEPWNPEEKKLRAKKGDRESRTRRLYCTRFVDYWRSRTASAEVVIPRGAMEYLSEVSDGVRIEAGVDDTWGGRYLWKRGEIHARGSYSPSWVFAGPGWWAEASGLSHDGNLGPPERCESNGSK
jgi:hypothetical protein